MTLAGCVGAPGPAAYMTAEPARPVRGDISGQTLAEVNAFRRASGLAPVRLDPAVTRAARAQAQAMAQAGAMSHSAGGDFRARLAANGVGRAPAVENIAWGVNSVSQAMVMWRGSSLHAQNMLTPDMTRLGVAAVPAQAGPIGLS